MSEALFLDVLGTPAPKGSSRAIARGGRAIVVPCSSDVGRRKMQAWTAAVYAAAFQTTCGGRGRFVDTALTVAVLFRLRRPDGHWRAGKYGEALKPSAPTFPAVKPDVDKLVRATLDALTGTVWDDDSRIVSLTAAKVYAAPGQEGASIAVRPREIGDADAAVVSLAGSFEMSTRLHPSDQNLSSKRLTKRSRNLRHGPPSTPAIRPDQEGV